MPIIKSNSASDLPDLPDLPDKIPSGLTCDDEDVKTGKAILVDNELSLFRETGCFEVCDRFSQMLCYFAQVVAADEPVRALLKVLRELKVEKILDLEDLIADMRCDLETIWSNFAELFRNNTVEPNNYFVDVKNEHVYDFKAKLIEAENIFEGMPCEKVGSQEWVEAKALYLALEYIKISRKINKIEYSLSRKQKERLTIIKSRDKDINEETLIRFVIGSFKDLGEWYSMVEDTNALRKFDAIGLTKQEYWLRNKVVLNIYAFLNAYDFDEIPAHLEIIDDKGLCGGFVYELLRKIGLLARPQPEGEISPMPAELSDTESATSESSRELLSPNPGPKFTDKVPKNALETCPFKRKFDGYSVTPVAPGTPTSVVPGMSGF